MSKEIDCQGMPHSVGDCVEVTAWDEDGYGFLETCQYVGLILESERVEMEDPNADIASTAEWLYRVSLPDGRVIEAWDYEVKNVNAA